MLVSVPPAIPRTRKSEPGWLDEYLTLWVSTGTAHLRDGDGREYRIDAGTVICVPPGTEHDVWTEPGTLVIPAWSTVPPVAAAAENIALFPIAERDRPRLLERYSRWAWDDSPLLRGSEPLSPNLGIGAEPGDARPAPSRPPMPVLGPARRVATELGRRPASDRSLDEWAAWAACSPSTLRRGFLAQTGSTFAHWRQLTRLAVAAELLAAGWPVGRVRTEVGFGSRWGFSDAFRVRYGVPPREFGAQTTRTGDTSPSRPLVGPIEEAEAEDRLLPDNVMLWVRAGELRARYAERLWVGRAGDVVWLPAGSTVENAPDASVPLSTLCTGCVQLDRPRRARFSPAWREWLLWASVSTNSLLKSEEHRGRVPALERVFHTHVIDAFTAQRAIERARGVPMPQDDDAKAAAAAFLNAMGTATESGTHDVPAALHQTFRRETGMTFATWRHAARMRLARHLLQSGRPSGVVAARVGYSMVSNFSRAFSRFHGVGPREFQQLEGPDEIPAAG